VNRQPLGPGGTFKTGQRVPANGHYIDQFGVVTWHERGATFPPCVDRKGTCAFRRRYSTARASA
jgi:hypothetical protein